MEEKCYYSLRLLGSNAYHAKGDVLKTTYPVLHIGETADCAIRYEAGPYEPECYATIVANDDGQSWRLVQRSPYVQAQIAGQGGIGYVHALQDGDVIRFSGQPLELEFHVHHDNHYGKSGVVIEQRTNRTVGFWLLAVCLCLLAVGSWYMLSRFQSDEITYDELKEFLPSVYILQVDSVQWIEVSGRDTTLVRPTMTMEQGGVAGTAFLTTDGKLLTARHCIEYWIGEDLDLTLDVTSLDDEDIRKWAILAETFMQERSSSRRSQQLRVFFSIYSDDQPDVPLYRFSSMDSCVHFNRSRDGILQLADYHHNYYWRTVRPQFNDQEMELGDIVWMDVTEKGRVALADATAIYLLDQASPVAVLGYPNNASGKKVTYASGTIKENRSDTLRTVSPNLIFDANITHGFSGGPLLMRTPDGKVVAAGVVSKIDTDNGIYKKAVPVTEVGNIIGKEEEP